MSLPVVFKGVIGFKFLVEFGLGLSGGGDASLVVTKPDGSVATWSGTIEDAASGIVSYTTASVNTIDQTGTWRINAKWEPGGGSTFYGETACFRVLELGDCV